MKYFNYKECKYGRGYDHDLVMYMRTEGLKFMGLPQNKVKKNSLEKFITFLLSIVLL